jgi:hypothetical protein
MEEPLAFQDFRKYRRRDRTDTPDVALALRLKRKERSLSFGKAPFLF